jgi:hypothetical protein
MNSGTVTASAGGAIYVQGTSQDLTVSRVTAGGTVNITAPRSILSTGTGTQITTPGNVTLVAGTGSIGSAAAPIQAQIGGQLTLASAAQNIYIHQVGTDLDVNQVNANGQVRLTSDAGIDPVANSGINVQSQALDLEVGTDVGSASAPLQLQLGSGQLTGTVGRNVYVTSPAALNVGQLTSTTGSITLLDQAGGVTLGQVTAAGTVTITAQAGNITNGSTTTAAFITAPTVTLTALLGTIGTAASPLMLDTSGSATSTFYAYGNTGVYIDDTRGDLRLSQVTAAHGDVGLVAAGSILNKSGGTGSVVNGANVTLTAQGGSIGVSGTPLVIDSATPTTGVLNASAATSAYITQAVGSLTVASASAGTGSLVLAVPAGNFTQQAGGTLDAPSITVNVPGASATATFYNPSGINTSPAQANGLLTVNGGAGAGTTLIVNDTANQQARTGTLSAGAITGLGMGGQGMDYNTIQTLFIDLGSGGNTFTVANTAAGTTTTVNSGTGSDVVNVQATSSPTIVNTGGGTNTNTVNVGSKEPATGGIVDNIQGALTVVGDGTDTLNVDDTGSTAQKSGTLTPTTLTGLNMGAAITYGGLTTLSVRLGSGGSIIPNSPVGNTFTINDINPATHTSVDGGVSGNDTVNVTTAADFNGRLDLTAFEHGTVTVNGNLNGTLTDTLPGHLETVKVVGSVASGGSLLAGGIDTMTVGQDLAGTVTESGTINLLSIGGSLTSTGVVNAVNTATSSLGAINTLTIGQNLAGAVNVSGTIQHLNIVNGSITPTASLSLGNLSSLVIGLNHLSVGQNMAGTLSVTGNLGSVQVAGGIPGWIKGGHIGTIAAYGGYGPVVLRVTENGVERRVEEAVPGAAYPLPNPSAVAGAPYVNVQFFYEGTLPGSSGTLANPQLTARVTNNVGTGRDQYDLSLVTYNDAAKFNLARLAAAGVAGVRNVDVEGDVLTSVSSAASSFFAGDSTPAGIRLPQDNLAGVGVRDFTPNASIQAASIQAVAFGSHATANGLVVTGVASAGADAQALLVSGTAMAYANDTYRAPFADLATQQVQLFLVTNPSGGSFNNNGILLTVESVTSPNAAGTANVVTPSNVARGAVTALVEVVPTYNSKGQLQSPVVQEIDLRGDGGSIQTQEPFAATAAITSTGLLGDLTISSAQGINNVTAPSMFGSLTTPGPITGLVQTTGQRTDPITSVVTTVPADLGRLYVNTSGKVPVVTNTTVTTGGLSGELVSRGDLISQVTLSGGPLSGALAVQGNLGKVFTPSSGPATRLGGVLVSPTNTPFSGEVVVLGQVLADMRFNGGLKGGRIAAKGGIAGNLLINGGLDSGAAVVSGGEIGDTTLGTQFTVSGTNKGILAAKGAMNFAKGSPGGNVFNNATGANAAAIDAIFTDGGKAMALDQSGLDLAGLSLILTDLAALYVNSQGNLAGPKA